MDELTALAQLRTDVPGPTPDALAAARARLVEHEVRPAVLARADEIVATGAYALTGGSGAAGHDPTRPLQAAPRSSTAPTHRLTPLGPVVIPAHYANAGQVLDVAAAQAARTTDTALADGQYRYTRVHSLDVTTVDGPPPDGDYEFSENLTESWIPASAHDLSYFKATNDISVRYPTAAQRRYARSLPGGIPQRYVEWDAGRNGTDTQQLYPPVGAPSCSGGCGDEYPAWDGPTRANVAKLPTSVPRLRADLVNWATALHREATKYRKPTRLSAIELGAIGSVLDSQLAPSRLRSALFLVAKAIPGVTLTGRVANYDHVRGLGIGVVDPFHVEQNLIFDTAGRYLGQQQVVRQPSPEYRVKAGTVVAWTAITSGVQGKPTLPKGAHTPH